MYVTMALLMVSGNATVGRRTIRLKSRGVRTLWTLLLARTNRSRRPARLNILVLTLYGLKNRIDTGGDDTTSVGTKKVSEHEGDRM